MLELKKITKLDTSMSRPGSFVLSGGSRGSQMLKNIIAYLLLVTVSICAVYLLKLREDERQIRELAEINLTESH
jgi:hypothetical protein